MGKTSEHIVIKMMPDYIDESGEYYRGDAIIDAIKTGKLRQDDSCHWYLVPDERIEQFDRLLNQLENTLSLSDRYDDRAMNFDGLFRQYMVGGGIGNLSVIIP